MVITSLLGRVILVLLATGFLIYELMRIKRSASNLPERISALAVTMGIVGLFVDSFNPTGVHATTIMSISAALILGGIALDLGSSIYRKLAAGTDKRSRIPH